MTAKQFFKSTAFKCIAVLLSVLLVSGIILTLAYSLLKVDDEERFNRKISVVYDGDTVTSEEITLSGNTSFYGATIEKQWYIQEKNDYLIQASARGNGGSVTCWVALNMTADRKSVVKISKVLVYSVGDPAEFLDHISADVYDKFIDDYYPGKEFSYGTKDDEEYIETGASYTMTAICKSVNAAIDYAGGVVDPYENFLYRELVDTKKLEMSVDGTTVNYTIVTTGNGHTEPFTIKVSVDEAKTIKAYEITHNGSTEGYDTQMSEELKNLVGKNLDQVKALLNSVTTGASSGARLSNELCFNAAAFALANYDLALTFDKGGNA